MDHRHASSLDLVLRDLVHLYKEGFFPLCVTGNKGHVAILLVDDRRLFGDLMKETQRLVDAGVTVDDIYARAVVEKLWYDLGSAASAYRLVRRISRLLEQQAA